MQAGLEGWAAVQMLEQAGCVITTFNMSWLLVPDTETADLLRFWHTVTILNLD